MLVQNVKNTKEEIYKSQRAQIKRCCPNSGFKAKRDGVYLKDKKISNSHFVITSHSECTQSGNFYITVRYDSISGKSVQATFKREELFGNNLGRMLVAKGWDIYPNGERSLIQLLTLVKPKVTGPRSLLNANGWHTLPGGNITYAFGSKLITRPEDRNKVVRYMSSGQSTFSTSGSLEKWQENIAEKAKGNYLMELALATSFTSMLLYFSEKITGFGINLTGGSSRGKTTVIQIACTIFGNAGETSQNGRVNKAHSTDNGLEPMLAANNDSLMALDELGMFTGALGQLSYMLSGGKGKTRMTGDITQEKQFTWRTIVLSSGEVKASDMMQASTKSEVKAGQLLRFIDISIGNGTIENTHDQSVSKAEFADQIKNSANNYYGTAGVKFLEYLVNNYTRQELSETVENLHQYYSVLLSNAFPTAKPELKRVLNQLALVGVGAELAVHAGVLQYEVTEGNYPAIEEFIIKAAKRYLSESTVISDAERGVIKLKNFLLSNRNKFTEDGCTHGFKKVHRTKGTFFAIYKHAFNELTGQAGAYKAICKILQNKGLLHSNNKGRPLSRFKHKGEEIQVYAVRTKILELDDNLNPLTQKEKSSPKLTTRGK